MGKQTFTQVAQLVFWEKLCLTSKDIQITYQQHMEKIKIHNTCRKLNRSMKNNLKFYRLQDFHKIAINFLVKHRENFGGASKVA